MLYQANDALMKDTDGKHIQHLPVEQLDCCDQISLQAWDAYPAEYSGEGYVFGVPVNIQGPLLYYRRDLLPDNWKTYVEDISPQCFPLKSNIFPPVSKYPALS